MLLARWSSLEIKIYKRDRKELTKTTFPSENWEEIFVFALLSRFPYIVDPLYSINNSSLLPCILRRFYQSKILRTWRPSLSLDLSLRGGAQLLMVNWASLILLFWPRSHLRGVTGAGEHWFRIQKWQEKWLRSTRTFGRQHGPPNQHRWSPFWWLLQGERLAWKNIN